MWHGPDRQGAVLRYVLGFTATPAGGLHFLQARPKEPLRDLGRVGIGLGLMLLALHLLVETIQQASTAPVLENILVSLTGDPILDVLLAAALTLAAHSSVAVMLLLVGLSAGNVVTPVATIALVLGANLGGALPPVLETRSANPSNRRVPVGNLLFRAIGCAIVLPFVHPVAAALWQYDPDAKSAITNFHLAFNLGLAVAFLGLLGPAGALLTRLLPEKKVKSEVELARPLFLDANALETPYLALANAAREILRMGDLVDALLRLIPGALARSDKTVTEQATSLGRELDHLYEAVKGYLAKLDLGDLTERDMTRLLDLIEFAVNLGYAGDIVERDIIRAPTRGDGIGEADRNVLSRVHARVAADLHLALSTMMTEDDRSARELLDAKREINEFERTAARGHLAHLGGAEPAALAASTHFLSVLRDLKRVNSHLTTIGYAVMSPIGRSHSDRLVTPPPEEVG